MIRVVASVKVKEGQMDFFKSEVMKLVHATRQEEGCIAYDGLCSMEAPNVICFLEEWESKAHLDKHFETEHIKAYRKATADLVEEKTVHLLKEII